MRTVSEKALAAFSQQYGGEPVNIVEINWTDSLTVQYADKTLSQNILGKILVLSNFDNVVNLDGNTANQSFNIVLDDRDGTIKAIYDQNNFHKRKVNVYQWFTGIPINDKFLIFEGEINSPIIWKEGDRTFSFEIVSKIEDQEVGFSPEEGEFDIIPDDLIGREWPLPFGTCLKVPVIIIDPIPTGVTSDSLGVPDPSILKQLADLLKRIGDAKLGAMAFFEKALETYHSGEGQDSNPSPDNPLAIDQASQDAGDQYTEQGNAALAQAFQLQNEYDALSATLRGQQSFAKTSVNVSGGDCFPQGAKSTTRLNGVKVDGTFAGSQFIIDGVTHPSEEGIDYEGFQSTPVTTASTLSGQETIQKLGFTWLPAGVQFILTSDMVIRCIAAMLPCTVLNVWAYRNYGDTKLLTQVPFEYYDVEIQSFGTINATVIVLSRPLTAYAEGWEDSLYVDLVSPIGPNTVDIITWLIANYTELTFDPATFETVREQLSVCPSNFCLFEQKNIVSLLSEIAFQARCAIWLKNGVFYIQFLAAPPATVATITLDDVIVNTLEVHHTPTENIVTKLTATYKTDYSQTKEYFIILRNNTLRYGLHEQSYNWYTFNNPNVVDVASVFWMIRKSNTWKILQFKTPLTKISLETFDWVLVNFNGITHTGNLPGMIQSVKLDTNELLLEFEIWMPVRLGEMTQYDFAFPLDSDVHTGTDSEKFPKPGSNANGQLTSANGACSRGYNLVKNKSHRRLTEGQGVGENFDNSVSIVPQIVGLDPTPRPRFNYEYSTRSSSAGSPADSLVPTTYPAQIFSGDGPGYDIEAYPRGLGNRATRTKAVNIDHKSTLEPNTWIMVTVVVWSERAGAGRTNKSAKYFLPPSGKNVYPGRVVSGAADTYVVAIYKNGFTGTPTNVTVKQLQIDITDTIPPNTWALVAEGSKADGTGVEYTMQVPVFLE